MSSARLGLLTIASAAIAVAVIAGVVFQYPAVLGLSDTRFPHVDLDLRLVSWLAVPVLLLAAFQYVFIGRTVKPLRKAAAQLGAVVDGQPLPQVTLDAPGEVGELLRRFQRVLEAAERRIRALESEHGSMLTASKVLCYQKARIGAVLQSLPEGIIVLDEAATVTFANQKLKTLAGIEHQAIIGKKPNEWCEIPELLAFLSAFHGHAARRNEGESVELSPPHAPDTRVAVAAYPLYNPQDEAVIYGTLVVLHDVTLASLARKARKDFIANLSHELKTPLHVIGMYGETLLEEGGDSKAIRIEAGNVIKDEVERVTALINNMLNIAQIETGGIAIERTRTKLRELLVDAFDTVSRSDAHRDLEFALELPPELSAIHVDKNLLRVAVNNLLTNAIKYNRPGGEVVLGAREDADQMVVYVRDTGAGIAPEEQERIFDKFFRSQSDAVAEVAGHGLGLALAKEIVEMHHGRLEVQSTVGEGSTFSIVLNKTAVLLKKAV